MAARPLPRRAANRTRRLPGQQRWPQSSGRRSRRRSPTWNGAPTARSRGPRTKSQTSDIAPTSTSCTTHVRAFLNAFLEVAQKNRSAQSDGTPACPVVRSTQSLCTSPPARVCAAHSASSDRPTIEYSGPERLPPPARHMQLPIGPLNAHPVLPCSPP